MSVLVNGSPTEEFGMQRGLRQGDPLAPFLFLIVAEGLSALMRMAVSKGLYRGVVIGEIELRVSCLQFADDTIFVGEASIQNVLTVKSILQCFEISSGLKVNFFKSNLTGLNVEEGQLRMFANVLNCNVVKLPFTYLGLPVGANPRRVATWQPVIDKIQKRLALWKSKSLSIGGRILLHYVNS